MKDRPGQVFMLHNKSQPVPHGNRLGGSSIKQHVHESCFWLINKSFLLFPCGRRRGQVPDVDMRRPYLKIQNILFSSATVTEQQPHPNNNCCSLLICSDVLQTE